MRRPSKQLDEPAALTGFESRTAPDPGAGAGIESRVSGCTILIGTPVRAGDELRVRPSGEHLAARVGT